MRVEIAGGAGAEGQMALHEAPQLCEAHTTTPWSTLICLPGPSSVAALLSAHLIYHPDRLDPIPCLLHAKTAG